MLGKDGILTEQDKPKKKSYRTKVIIVMIVVMFIFWLATYLVADDPKVKECFKLAEQLEIMANEDQGLSDRVVETYSIFIDQCDFMIDMEEQRESNPELYDRLDRNE